MQTKPKDNRNNGETKIEGGDVPFNAVFNEEGEYIGCVQYEGGPVFPEGVSNR